MGGSITAALFLKEFINEGVEWAHLDIAGPVSVGLGLGLGLGLGFGLMRDFGRGCVWMGLGGCSWLVRVALHNQPTEH